MKILSLLLITLIFLLASLGFSTLVYGHGLGGETHPPVSLDGRDVTLSIDISPSIFDKDDPERYITINLSESKNQAVVEHVTFALEMSKDGEEIFKRIFHDDFGNLIIKVINDDFPMNEECVNMNNTKNIMCSEEFRHQSMKVFSVVDSSVGIFEDPKTQLTIVDLGSFYGIAGNGTIPDIVNVYRDNILWKTTTKETGIAPSTSHSEWQIPQTFFFNELPGKYKLVSITNNTETLVFEFIVKQITESEKNLLYLDEDDVPDKNNFEFINLAPMKQIASGIMPQDIICKEHLNLVFKINNGAPACVMSTTMEKLIERGWILNY